jgi:hypothetical protein
MVPTTIPCSFFCVSPYSSGLCGLGTSLSQLHTYVTGMEVLTVILNAPAYSYVGGYQCFGGICYLHLRGSSYAAGM